MEELPEFIKPQEPAQPGSAQVKNSGRVSLWVALCTHCGMSQETFATKDKAFSVAVGHWQREHPDDVKRYMASKPSPNGSLLRDLIKESEKPKLKLVEDE